MKTNFAIFRKLASVEANYERKLAVDAANKGGKPMQYEKNDRVLFFKATSQPRAGRRAKHEPLFHAGIVLDRHGSSGLKIRCEKTGRIFFRHQKNVSKNSGAPRSPEKAGGAARPVDKNAPLAPQEIILYAPFAEGPDRDKIVVAQVTEAREEDADIDVFGTASAKFETSTWKFVFIHNNNDQKLALRALSKSKQLRGHYRWERRVAAQGDPAVKLRDLQLTKAGRLTAQSLARCSGFSHFYYK